MDAIFKRRHSVRSFLPREVLKSDLHEILEAADSAPSAGNLKAREVVTVINDALKRRLVSASYTQEFIFEAPVVLVFFAVPGRSALKYGPRGETLYAIQDATIAASFAWLQAVTLGLGAGWVGAFDDEEVKRALNAATDWRPVAIMPVGYPAE
jgi:nitroreductase